MASPTLADTAVNRRRVSRGRRRKSNKGREKSFFIMRESRTMSRMGCCDVEWSFPYPSIGLFEVYSESRQRAILLVIFVSIFLPVVQVEINRRDTQW